MTEWREKCGELIDAAAKATPRPWGNDAQVSPWFNGALPGVRVTYKIADRPDSRYAALAANNADRLVRFLKEVVLEYEAVAEQLGGKGTLPMCEQRLSDLWKESADE